MEAVDLRLDREDVLLVVRYYEHEAPIDPVSYAMVLGDGFDANFNSVKNKIFTVHMRDLYLEEYPFRKLLNGLVANGFTGFTFAEIPESKEPVRLMKYYRSLWLAYQDLL